MTTSLAAAHLRRAPRAPRLAIVLGAGSLLATVAAVALPEAGWARLVVTLVLLVTLLVVAIEDHDAGVLCAVGYLAVLGLLRRLVSMVQADPSADPLLVVAPILASVLALLALRAGAHRRRTALTIAVGAFFAISVIGVLNPIYPVRANVRGLLFWSAPLLWFPVGRSLVPAALVQRVLRLVMVLGTGACLTGIVQATVGFPPWDAQWIRARGYIALGIDGPYTLRPFGWSASSGEFALTAAIVGVLCGIELASAIRRRSRVAGATAAFGLGVATVALILSAVRTAVLLGLLAAVVVALAQRRAHVVRVLIGLGLAVLVLVTSVRVLEVERWTDHGIRGLVRRSLVGLADPFDPQESTLSHHIELTDQALRTLDDRPLGGGAAYGTTGGDGATRAPSAENDLGNSALAFGIPGAALVLAITFLGLRGAWRAVRAGPTLLTLGGLAILVASLRFWWTGGQYAPSMLIWLVLGWTDRPRADPDP